MKYLNRLILIIAILILVNTIYSESIWSSSTRLTWTFCSSYYPDVVADSNRHIHVVWADNLGYDLETLYKKSTDGGATWSALKRLTWGYHWSWYPALTADFLNTIHVVWSEFQGGTEIFYKRKYQSISSPLR